MYRAQGASPPATIAHSYTPCTAGHLLVSIKGMSRAFLRHVVSTRRRRGGTHNTPRETLVTPTTSTPVRDNASHISLLCSILHQPIWAGTRNNKFTGWLKDLAGPKRRQLARQVGERWVLTNTFPLSSRWVASCSLFSRGRCSASGVSSSCPLTAVTTWYSSPRSATTTVVSSPGSGELDDDFPPWQKRNTRVCPATLFVGGGGDGATVAMQEAAPRWLSGQSESTTPAPLRGAMSGVVLAPETTTGVASPHRANPERTDDASTLAKDLLGVSLVPEITVQSIPDATSPPSVDQEVPSVFHPVPFRFSLDPPSDPASVSAFARACPDLPGYHMWSSWDRLTAVSTSGLAGSEEDDDSEFGWDFSGLSDPSAMRDFMSACDYCLSGCSNDGLSLGDEGCDPSHECFHIDQGDHGGDNHLGMPEDDNTPVPASCVDIPRELAVVPVSAGGQDTQLEQFREMQARFDEEEGRLVQLRQNIKQEWAGRTLAGGAPHRAQDVQRRIIDDARARLPPAFSGVGQNLVAATMLLRTMPEPSTTEGRRIQGELKDLLEDVAVRRAESSASRRQGCPSEHRAMPS
jgi:hypothetical protein